MNFIVYLAGAAVLVFFIYSVVSLVLSIVKFSRKKKQSKVPEPEIDVNDIDNKSDKEV